MKLHDLKPNPGSKKKKTRVGRGISAGQGKTAGRGTKGAGARGSSARKGAYFEGGQLPLVRRLPFKRGFTNIFRIEYQEVTVERLNLAFDAGTVVTPALLAEKRLVRDADKPVVVLGNGAISTALTLKVHRITKGAQEKVTQAGGTVDLLPIKVKGARATVKLLPKAELAKLNAEG